MTDDDRPSVRDRLERALADVEPDNPVAATRMVARVARSYRPETRSQWEAFRFTAVKALRPFFEARDMDPAKATAWAVVDPYHGQLQRHGTSTPPREETPPDRSGRRDSGSTTRSCLVRQRPDPSNRGPDDRDPGSA